MSRRDLNRWHLLARGGIIDHDFSAFQLLSQKNKNGWLPVHLAKNKNTAQWLYDLTTQQNISINDIVQPALINNAQSIQTKYGIDLMTFLVEEKFSLFQAKNAAVIPSTQSRIDLSYYWLSLANFDSFFHEKKHNPIENAIAYSNSYFFIALHQLIIEQPSLKSIVILLINSCPYEIGDIYLQKDRAFQLKQVLKQHFDIDKKINHITVNGINSSNGTAINNLEGF